MKLSKALSKQRLLQQQQQKQKQKHDAPVVKQHDAPVEKLQQKPALQTDSVDVFKLAPNPMAPDHDTVTPAQPRKSKFLSELMSCPHSDLAHTQILNVCNDIQLPHPGAVKFPEEHEVMDKHKL